jgi:hypothetical protein
VFIRNILTSLQGHSVTTQTITQSEEVQNRIKRGEREREVLEEKASM